MRSGLGISISLTHAIDAREPRSAVSLVFASGERPSADAVAALAAARARFAISHDPRQSGTGSASDRRCWLELLTGGLTFDLVGLAGGPPAPPPPREHSFGLQLESGAAQLEAITLQPGPHLAAGGAMLPVVRSLASLAASLAELPGVVAVAWHPGRCWSAPRQFRDSVARWMEGGVFPAFSLAALAATPDGALQSEGLALFTGQELRIEPGLAHSTAEAGKIGLRLLHWLFEHGTLTEEVQIAAPDRSPVRLAPSDDGTLVRALAA